ncbi:MAG: sigma 54-interacting transcriptional regulator [Immundisolibacter sp.]|uniref:sigma 54-interacting transcriptional regulator n=1 Tax=Immundisolibacter sp. TaxID=1934948 RepID=UPI003D0AF62C
MNETLRDLPLGAALGAPDIQDLLWIPGAGGGAWLGEQRVLLFYPSSYQALVRALMEDAGPEAARRAIMRMGYTAGTNSAALLHKAGDGEVNAHSFTRALQMLSIVGVAQAGEVEVDIDAARGRFQARISWTQSLDADFYLSNLGLSAGPVCHSLVGYMNAYASALVGVPVAFREVECQACGHAQCRVIGHTVADWGDEAAELDYSRPHALINRFATGDGTAHPSDDPDLVGASPGFTGAFQLLERVAPTTVDVLLLGETGVGKELFARALHRISPRRDGPFVAVNCAALPDGLIEAELFGVERGAFTGATRSRAGRFERAHQGTLFLDEIGTLSYAAQSKLLRVLQTREIERVGGDHTQRVDVRVAAATNEALETAVREGRFREDLYFRLSTFPVRIPPLRERTDDIPLLVGHFLARYRQLHGRRVSGFTTAALKALMQHAYPGNVRELEQLIERAVILTPDDQPIDVTQLFFRPLAGLAASSGPRIADTAVEGTAPQALRTLLDENWSLGDLGEAFVELALERSAGNVAQAARLLGVSRAQIDYRIRRRRGRAATE